MIPNLVFFYYSYFFVIFWSFWGFCPLPPTVGSFTMPIFDVFVAFHGGRRHIRAAIRAAARSRLARFELKRIDETYFREPPQAKVLKNVKYFDYENVVLFSKYTISCMRHFQGFPPNQGSQSLNKDMFFDDFIYTYQRRQRSPTM